MSGGSLYTLKCVSVDVSVGGIERRKSHGVVRHERDACQGRVQ